jgi:Aminoglycoside 3-N-acetyltransferase
VDVNAVTLYHTAEELLESQLRVSPLTRDTFRLECVAPDGRIVVIETRLFEPEVSRRRNLDRLVPELKHRGAWREAKVGRLSVVLINAQQVIEAVAALASRGIYCYDESHRREKSGA